MVGGAVGVVVVGGDVGVVVGGSVGVVVGGVVGVVVGGSVGVIGSVYSILRTTGINSWQA